MSGPRREPFAQSVCHGCRFMRRVESKRGSVFLQCTEGSLPKYGPQPVLACAARQDLAGRV